MAKPVRRTFYGLEHTQENPPEDLLPPKLSVGPAPEVVLVDGSSDRYVDWHSGESPKDGELRSANETNHSYRGTIGTNGTLTIWETVDQRRGNTEWVYPIVTYASGSWVKAYGIPGEQTGMPAVESPTYRRRPQP